MSTDLEPHEELALLRRAEIFDREALGEVHERYYSDIFRYISFRVQDYEATADLTSDVFERLLQSLRDQHAPRNTIRGWLYGTAKHVVQDFFRQRTRRHPAPVPENWPSGEEAPDVALDQQWQADRLTAALGRLTEEQQQVLAMRFGQGFSVQATADQLGKSVGAVKMLQARAVAMLTELMSN